MKSLQIIKICALLLSALGLISCAPDKNNPSSKTQSLSAKPEVGFLHDDNKILPLRTVNVIEANSRLFVFFRDSPKQNFTLSSLSICDDPLNPEKPLEKNLNFKSIREIPIAHLLPMGVFAPVANSEMINCKLKLNIDINKQKHIVEILDFHVTNIEGGAKIPLPNTEREVPEYTLENFQTQKLTTMANGYTGISCDNGLRQNYLTNGESLAASKLFNLSPITQPALCRLVQLSPSKQQLLYSRKFVLKLKEVHPQLKWNWGDQLYLDGTPQKIGSLTISNANDYPIFIKKSELQSQLTPITLTSFFQAKLYTTTSGHLFGGPPKPADAVFTPDSISRAPTITFPNSVVQNDLIEVPANGQAEIQFNFAVISTCKTKGWGFFWGLSTLWHNPPKINFYIKDFLKRSTTKLFTTESFSTFFRPLPYGQHQWYPQNLPADYQSIPNLNWEFNGSLSVSTRNPENEYSYSKLSCLN